MQVRLWIMIPPVSHSWSVPSAWTLFAAAAVSNPAVRDELISPLWSRANLSWYFPAVYHLDPDASTISGLSRYDLSTTLGAVIELCRSPEMGAMFSILGAK